LASKYFERSSCVAETAWCITNTAPTKSVDAWRDANLRTAPGENSASIGGITRNSIQRPIFEEASRGVVLKTECVAIDACLDYHEAVAIEEVISKQAMNSTWFPLVA